MALRYTWDSRTGAIGNADNAIRRQILSGVYFQMAQQWMVDAEGAEYRTTPDATVVFHIDDDTTIVDAYSVFKGAQLRHRDAGGASASDAVVRLGRLSDRGVGTLVRVLLALVCQYEHECREDGSMPRVCVVLGQRDRQKTQELLALLQPCGADEFVTSEQLLDFIGLISKQWCPA